jgi:hypothetical protein
MKKILSILSYHNAIPLAAVVLTMGAGAALAAGNPEAIFSAQETVLAVDNTYIASIDLDSYTPKAQITAVTEDTDNYYVAYSFSTVALANAVWQQVTKTETLKISKAELGASRDLGVYVTEQLKEKIDTEITYLKKVQEFESKSITQKQIATAYGGLIGKLLDDKTETLPGYIPVVDAPELQVEPAAPVVAPLPQVPPPAPAAPVEVVAPAAPEVATTTPDTATTTAVSTTTPEIVVPESGTVSTTTESN